jgi:hypothetical protein
MLQSALSSHTILSRPPHLPQRRTDIHMFIKQFISLVNREWNKPPIYMPAPCREREQEWATLVSLILLFLRFG